MHQDECSSDRLDVLESHRRQQWLSKEPKIAVNRRQVMQIPESAQPADQQVIPRWHDRVILMLAD